MTVTTTAPRHGNPDEQTVELPHVEAPSTTPRPNRPRPAPSSGRGVPGPAVAGAVGACLGLIGALLVGFLVYLFALSGVTEAHAQSTLYKTFRNQLALAVAPTGPTTAGRPVAIIDAPALDLRRTVVVEGTGAASLTRGPGHRVDSPLPGQPGISLIYGRRVTFGAPFAHFTRLQQNDMITVTTAQGVSRFEVMQFGDARTPLTQFPDNGLVLSTADSQTYPHHTYTVVAALVGQPFGAGAARPAVPDSQRALAADSSALQPLMMWALLLALVVTAVTVLRQRWARWPTYLCAAPVVLAALWNVYENAAQLLPNLY